MDSVNEILIECVKALGGSKKVGAALWPEIGADAAQRKLLDSLNTERTHKLCPEQAQTILKWSRDAGYHDGWAAWCAITGYTRSDPISDVDERAELRRQVKALASSMQDLVARLERVGG
jgi:hypothetical protein